MSNRESRLRKRRERRVGVKVADGTTCNFKTWRNLKRAKSRGEVKDSTQ